MNLISKKGLIRKNPYEEIILFTILHTIYPTIFKIYLYLIFVLYRRIRGSIMINVKCMRETEMPASLKALRLVVTE